MLRKISRFFAKKEEKREEPAYVPGEEKLIEVIEEKSIPKRCEEYGLDYVQVRGILRQLLDRGTVDELSYESKDEKKRSDCMHFISENFAEMCKRANFETTYKMVLIESDSEKQILVLKASV